MIEKKLAWLTALFSVFVLAPIIVLLFGAFGSEDGGASASSLGLLKLTSRQWLLLGRSVLLGMGAGLGSIFIGAPLAFLFYRTDMWGRNFFRKIYLLSLVLPPFVQAIVWSRLPMAGGIGPSRGVYGLWGALFVYILSFYPIVTVLVSSGLQAIDNELEETARLQRGPLAVIRKITLPLVFPHIACGGILVFVFCIANFEVADILGVKVYPLEIFIYFSAYYDEKSATILSLPLVGVTLFLVWAQMHYMGRKSYVNLGRLKNQLVIAYPLGRFRHMLSLFPTTIIGLSLILPVFYLFQGVGSLESFVKALNGGAGALWYSLWVSMTSALVMVIIAFPVAYYLVRFSGWRSKVMNYLVQAPFGFPSIVLGIGLIVLWNRSFLDAVYGTSLLLVIAMATAYSPFVVKIIGSGILRIDEDMESAGRMGAKPWRVITKVVLPLAAPSIAVGWAVGFVLALSNLGTSLLIVAPGRSTLPITIYNYLHYGADEMVCALSLLLVAIMAVPLLVAVPIYKYGAGRVLQ